jgi:hypothetical protein
MKLDPRVAPCRTGSSVSTDVSGWACQRAIARTETDADTESGGGNDVRTSETSSPSPAACCRRRSGRRHAGPGASEASVRLVCRFGGEAAVGRLRVRILVKGRSIGTRC